MIPHAPPPDRQGIGTQLAMTAFSLAVLGALVLWQVRTDGEEATAPASSTTRSSMTEGATPVAGSVAVDAKHAAQSRTASPTIYLVESRERAEALLAGIEEENRHRDVLGLPPLTPQLVWFDSVEAEVLFWATIEARQQPAGGSAVGNSVIDLRDLVPAGSAPPEVAVPLIIDRGYVVAAVLYLVDGLEAQRVLTDLGLGAHERVLVVTTDEDADQVRASQGQRGATVIDLRSPAEWQQHWRHRRSTLRTDTSKTLDAVSVIDLQPSTGGTPDTCGTDVHQLAC
jgi:hypothetical protein